MLVCSAGSFAVFSQLVDALRRRRGSGLQFLDFVRLASYSGTESTGKVTLIGPNPAGQPVVPDSHVLVVEDIVDTGNTIAALRGTPTLSHPLEINVRSGDQNQSSGADAKVRKRPEREVMEA